MGNEFSFYRHGLKVSRRYGYEANLIKNKERLSITENADLSGSVYMVTGANSGIGFELTKYFAQHKATVYMVCRNEQRAAAARDEIVKECENSDGDNVRVLLGDMGVSTDVRRVVTELQSKEEKLTSVICCAGTATNTRQFTSEGLETTYACHLQNGAYLLTTLLIPLLKASGNGRCIILSSGGMYQTRVPSWPIQTGQEGKHTQLYSYAHQKRAQVHLAERFAEEYKSDSETIKFVSCHPGWVDTPNVKKLGFGAIILKPLRTPWQGSHGIAWLSMAPLDQIESGEFYIDGLIQEKYIMNGTTNTKEEIDQMMQNLKDADERLKAETAK